MSPELIISAQISDLLEKSPRQESPSKTSLNTTQDSATEELLSKFALNLVQNPAFDASQSELCGDSESEDLEMSLHSLGLDFV